MNKRVFREELILKIKILQCVTGNKEVTLNINGVSFADRPPKLISDLKYMLSLEGE